MVDADVARLNAELTAVFPTLRFIEYEYWRPATETGASPLPAPRVRYRFALTDTRDYCHPDCWLEPEGWIPEWTKPNDDGYRFLANQPKPLIIWHPPVLSAGSWDAYTGRNLLRHADLVARYDAGDDEHLRLINRAWRLLKRIAVNNIELCQNVLEMEAVLGPVRSDTCWIGHEALKWLYEDPRRVIWHRHRPCDAIDRALGWWNLRKISRRFSAADGFGISVAEGVRVVDASTSRD